MRESTFSFWQDAEFNALPDQPLAPEDNAFHPPEAGELLEETWVFEAFSLPEFYLRAVFRLSHSGRPSARTGLLWRVGGQSGQEVGNVPWDEVSASTAYCQVKIGPQEAAYRDEQYILKLKSPRLSGELMFRPELPGWQPGIGRIAYGDRGRLSLAWKVPVPRAAVQGEITLEGKTHTLNGVGYHDHRRCNFLLKEALAGAYIARLYSEERTLLLADFWGNLLYSGKHVTALYASRGRENHLSTPHVDLLITGASQGQILLEARTGSQPMIDLALQASPALGGEEYREGLVTGSAKLFPASGRLRLATHPEEEDRVWGILENLTIQR